MKKSRDYLFDHYKALLILLVVTGHFVELASKDNGFLCWVKWMIFSFHMPAFIFISGYFSKKKGSLVQLIRKLAVPYLVFEVLYYLLYTYVIHKETQLWLLYPKFSLWYLMALLVWKMVTPWIMKIPGHMILAIAAGLWAGCSGLDDNFLTLPRMLVFYPFFLIGVHTERENVTRLRERVSKKTAWMVLLFFGVVAAGISAATPFSPKIFYGRYDYDYLQQNTVEGILMRLVCYGVSLTVTMLVLVILSEQESRFSYLGKRTMAVYLFHGLFYSCVKAGWGKLGDVGNVMETLLLLGISVGLTALLSRKPFTDILNKITG